MRFKKIAEWRAIIEIALTVIALSAVVIARLLDWPYSLKLLPIILSLILAFMIFKWPANPIKKVYCCIAILLGSWLINWLLPLNFSEIFGTRLAGVPVVLAFFWLIIIISAWNIVLIGYTKGKYYLAILLVGLAQLLLARLGINYAWLSTKSSSAVIVQTGLLLLIALAAFWFFDKKTGQKTAIFYNAIILPLLSIFLWLMLIVR